MRNRKRWLAPMVLLVLAPLVPLAASLHGCVGGDKPALRNPQPEPGSATMQVVKDIKQRIARFAPTRIDFDDSLLTPELRPVVAKLVEAAKVMDEIFLVQADPGNPKLRSRLAADPAMADALTYFDIMFGPWDRRQHHEPFVGTRKRFPGAGFYPPDMTKKELQDHLRAHPQDKAAFTGYFTVIRRRPDRSLEAIPYSVFYRDKLARAARLLREAANLSSDARLQRYLRSRAKAFETNDYRPSDMDWMDLGDGAVEVVIGPYEVYEDSLFGYKASFTAFLNLRDKKYSERLQKIAPHMGFLQASLPMAPEDKEHSRGGKIPIVVVEELFTAGDTKAGVQTLAFNLPNDEVVRRKKGFKLVLLKNVAQAKFKKILLPIAKVMMAPDQIQHVTFDGFFTDTLMHESAHGLGPGMITVRRGTRAVKTDVNKALKELYSTIEEAKADIVGLYCSHLLIDKGVLPARLQKQVYASYLAGFFRSVRFGASEAHGRANMISFNYLLGRGGIAFDRATNKYRVDFDKIRGAVKALARDLLEIEARGDYHEAKAFIEKHGKMSAEMEAALGRLTGIPVDIRPQYTILQKMKSWNK